MNTPDFFSDAGGNRPSPRKELQLQGPRPAALKVNKDSHKIRKPPVAPPPHLHPPLPHPSENRQPVIIYAVPPKIIHTTVSDYKSLVQRLTGNTTTDGATSSSSPYAGDLSPAARLASVEKTSPRKEREASGGADNEISNQLSMGDFVGDTNVELGAVPGILSPAPGSLPQISPGFFSPALPPISPGLWSPAGDPFMMGYNMFVTSPSTLFTAPMVSPSPSSYHVSISYARSSGPGGQNVNIVDTKVDMRFNVKNAYWLSEWVRERIMQMEKNRINKDGEIVISSTKTRTQKGNIEDDFLKLQAINDAASYVPPPPSEETMKKIAELSALSTTPPSNRGLVVICWGMPLVRCPTTSVFRPQSMRVHVHAQVVVMQCHVGLHVCQAVRMQNHDHT